MLSSSFFYETIQYFLIGFLLYHILIFRFCVSKSTVARLMVSDFCWICPLIQHWYEWLNVVLLHKDHLFPQLHSQHPSTNLLHFWVHKLPIHSRYKHWDRMDVFNCKRNKFVQIVFCSQCLNDFWLYWTSGSTKMHLMEATSGLLQLLCQTCRLHYPSWVYWLMSVLQKLDDNSRCNVAYKRFFLYNRLAHGPVYTRTTDDWLVEPRNTDDWLVEPHCFMFLQGLSALFIHHLSNLMHHSHFCLCCKLNIFPRFDSQIETVFKLLHKYLVIDLNE